MKYLKNFYLSENKIDNSQDLIIDDIKDICLEFSDYEIDYSIKTNMKYYADNISGFDCIVISLKDNKNRFFTISDIEDVLLRLESYLKNTNWKIDCGFPADDTYLSLEHFLVEFSGEELYEMGIYIYHQPNKINESLSHNDLTLDVKDIFLELRDQGYEVDVDMRPQGVDMFSVSVSNDKLFDWKDVKEEFLRSKQMILDNHFSLQKVIVTYYPLGAFNGSGVRVLNRMRTEKFEGSTFSAFTHLVGDTIVEKGGKLYEIAFIFNLNNK